MVGTNLAEGMSQIVKWRRLKRARGIEDRRGEPRPGGLSIPIGGALGLPALVVVVVLIVINVTGGSGTESFDDVLDQFNGSQEPPANDPLSGADPNGELVEFLTFVHNDVQQFWQQTFNDAGRDYERARLVLFDSATQSGCGRSTSDIGPHYCPVDQSAYVDLDFFRELRRRFGARGDFAQAYVLAHELGHHLQNLLGIMSNVQTEQRQDPGRANELSIRLELQADCFAGVWAFTTFERNLLEAGDLQEGLRAAASIGDDRIQEQATGMVNPETWTHGSSEQRQRWFMRGFETGDANACDTFSADAL
jgi:predicted metalloprotease